jgi:hypothetical protein
MIYSDYRRAVASHISDRRTRQLCRLHLLRWWASDWNLVRIIAEMITSVHPPFENVVNHLKLYFYGPLPQVRQITPTPPVNPSRHLRASRSPTDVP